MLMVFLASLVGIYGWIISLTSIFKTGLGWDSVFDLNAARISLENAYSPSLETYYEIVPVTSEFYGTFVYKVANLFSTIFVHRSIFDDLGLIENYYFIDITTWLISLISVILVSISIYFVFESIIISSAYFALISTLPIWVGMSQVNSKDIPVAAGLTILSAGFALIFKNISSNYFFYFGLLLISLGAAISLSVRPATAMILLTFIAINSLALIYFYYNKLNLIAIIKKVFSIFIITIISALMILYSSNPISLFKLFSWIFDAIRVSLDYPSVQPIRLFGRDFLSNDLPSWYVMAWIWAQLPILTFLYLVLSILLLFRTSFVNRNLNQLFLIFPFLIQSFVVPIVFLFIQPNMYNGLRHILFIYPALMLLAAGFLYWVPFNFQNIYFQKVIFIFTCFVLLFNTFSTYRWAPYSYAFINPIAGLGEKRNWDLDYWGLSSREGIERLIKLGYGKDVIVMPDNSSSIPFGGQSYNQIPFKNVPFGLYVFIHWNHKIVEQSCKIDFEIKRDNQLLGMGGHCDYPFKS